MEPRFKSKGIPHIPVKQAEAVFVLVAEEHTLCADLSCHIVKRMIGIYGHGVFKIIHGAEIAFPLFFKTATHAPVTLDIKLHSFARRNVEKRKGEKTIIPVKLLGAFNRLLIPLCLIGKNAFPLFDYVDVGIVGHHSLTQGAGIVENVASVGIKHHKQRLDPVFSLDRHAEIAVSCDISSCKNTVLSLFKLCTLPSDSLGAFVVVVAENGNPWNFVFFHFGNKSRKESAAVVGLAVHDVAGNGYYVGLYPFDHLVHQVVYPIVVVKDTVAEIAAFYLVVAYFCAGGVDVGNLRIGELQYSYRTIFTKLNFKIGCLSLCYLQTHFKSLRWIYLLFVVLSIFFIGFFVLFIVSCGYDSEKCRW